MTWMQDIFGPSAQPGYVTSILLGGYIAGCLTTGYYLVRLRLHQDIRELGSGSVGARNAGRVLGIPGFLVTLAGDFAKGLLAVWLTWHFTNDDRLAALAMLAVVLGHIWPLQLGFRGGKGVATSLGALAVYDPHLCLAFLILVVLLIGVFWRSTPAGLLAFALLPVAAKFMDRDPVEVTAISILAGMILIAHWRNLLEEFTLLARRHGEPKPDESLK
jgi:acyl phosphate:glycerol-3-phosphate acyltransferase